ncbi:MAG: DUF3991 and toprim domain-containing protein [Ruthenibacterium sp.]
MPMSKGGKLYYTNEQYQHARYNTSALEYAKAQGYELQQDGNYFTMKGHDSMVFTKGGQWFWNSRELKGGAMEFIISYEQKSMVEAVLILNGELERGQTYIENVQKENLSSEPLEFELPEKDDNNRRVFAYLLKERQLDNDIVAELVHEKKIYQSAKHGNVVFVGFDCQGAPKSAFQRGTNTYAKESFKRDVAGSNKDIPFVMEAAAANCNRVYVFESCIDAISHATLLKLAGKDYKDGYRISLGGVAARALDYFLSNNKLIQEIVLCLDNDEPGKAAMKRIADHLNESKAYKIYVQSPRFKDFNEDLTEYRSNETHENQFDECDFEV